MTKFQKKTGQLGTILEDSDKVDEQTSDLRTKLLSYVKDDVEVTYSGDLLEVSTYSDKQDVTIEVCITPDLQDSLSAFVDISTLLLNRDKNTMIDAFNRINFAGNNLVMKSGDPGSYESPEDDISDTRINRHYHLGVPKGDEGCVINILNSLGLLNEKGQTAAREIETHGRELNEIEKAYENVLTKYGFEAKFAKEEPSFYFDLNPLEILNRVSIDVRNYPGCQIVHEDLLPEVQFEYRAPLCESERERGLIELTVEGPLGKFGVKYNGIEDVLLSGDLASVQALEIAEKLGWRKGITPSFFELYGADNATDMKNFEEQFLKPLSEYLTQLRGE
jgi:hypothetical protein